MTKNRHRSLAFCAALCLLVPIVPGGAQSPTPPTAPLPVPANASEMRGLWVVRDSLTSPARVRHVVVTAKAHGFNALFVQIRGRGDAFYQSDLEPRAEELSGQPATFDPLAEVVRLGHAAGLQIHAWMNTCFVWGAGHRPRSARHVVNQHPEWLARDAHGHFLLKAGPECEGAFLTPANLDARRHIHDVFLDVARRYDVDGIHFDYVRYANSGYDYSGAALARFRVEQTSATDETERRALARREVHDRLAWPHAFPAAWQEFRRRQVTEMVGEISRDIKAVKPWVIVSAAVFADSKDALSTRGQDWKTWLERGYLDAVVPMAYGSSTPKVAAQIADAVACAHAAGRYAYAGIGSWHIPAASTIAKINAEREVGAQGTVLFSYGGVTHDGTSETYLNTIAAHCFPGAASPPPMSWLNPRPTTQAQEEAAPTKEHVRAGG